MHMERFPETGRAGKAEEESKPKHFKEQLEYLEKSWRKEETRRHSDFREKPVNPDVKNLNGENIYIYTFVCVCVFVLLSETRPR